MKFSKNSSLYLSAVIITVAILFAYSPVFKANFVNFDDNAYVVKNDSIKNLSWQTTAKFFYAPTHEIDIYIPLVFLSYSIEYYFSQLDPHRYHTDNVLLHILNSLLVLWLVWLLTKNILASVSIAGLFALHPLHVESVAWIAERKDVLYAAFYLGALISYHYYSHTKQQKYYIFCLLLFVLSCFSKAMAITLPAVLLLYDYYYSKQRSWKMVLKKIPFFIVSVLFVGVTLLLMDVSKKQVYTNGFNQFDDLVMVLHNIFFYIQKLALPIQLSAIYFYPVKSGAVLPVYYLGCAVLALIAIWFIGFSQYSTTLVKACFLFFMVTILPVLQFFHNTYTPTADRYSYLPALGLFGILAYWLNKEVAGGTLNKNSAWVGAMAVLLLLSVATRDRCSVWANSIAFYSDITAKGQNKDFVMGNLADAYIDNGEYKKAEEVLVQANALYPNEMVLLNRYAWLMAADKRYDIAIEKYKYCLLLDSTLDGTYINLGEVYLKTGQPDSALKIYERAIRLFPHNLVLIYNTGYTYFTLNKKEEASRYMRFAAKNNFEPAVNFLKQLPVTQDSLPVNRR